MLENGISNFKSFFSESNWKEILLSNSLKIFIINIIIIISNYIHYFIIVTVIIITFLEKRNEKLVLFSNEKLVGPANTKTKEIKAYAIYTGLLVKYLGRTGIKVPNTSSAPLQSLHTCSFKTLGGCSFFTPFCILTLYFNRFQADSTS